MGKHGTRWFNVGSTSSMRRPTLCRPRRNVWYLLAIPCKHEMLCQCCGNAGTASTTLAQHYHNIDSTFCTRWATARDMNIKHLHGDVTWCVMTGLHQMTLWYDVYTWSHPTINNLICNILGYHFLSTVSFNLWQFISSRAYVNCTVCVILIHHACTFTFLFYCRQPIVLSNVM